MIFFFLADFRLKGAALMFVFEAVYINRGEIALLAHFALRVIPIAI